MSRRLDDTDLDNLESAAKGGMWGMLGQVAHPLDVLRLVEEVRWYKNRYSTLSAELREELDRAALCGATTLRFDAEGGLPVTDRGASGVTGVLNDRPVYGPSDLRPWASGTNPDPTIKSSFVKVAEQVRKDCELMTRDESIEVTIPAGTFIPFGTEIYDTVVADLIRQQSLPKNDEKLLTGYVLWSLGTRYWFPGWDKNVTFGSDRVTEQGKFVRSLIERDKNAKWKLFINEPENCVAAYQPCDDGDTPTVVETPHTGPVYHIEDRSSFDEKGVWTRCRVKVRSIYQDGVIVARTEFPIKESN